MSLHESKLPRLIDKHVAQEAERKAAELEQVDVKEKAKTLKVKKRK